MLPQGSQHSPLQQVLLILWLAGWLMPLTPPFFFPKILPSLQPISFLLTMKGIHIYNVEALFHSNRQSLGFCQASTYVSLNHNRIPPHHMLPLHLTRSWTMRHILHTNPASSTHLTSFHKTSTPMSYLLHYPALYISNLELKRACLHLTVKVRTILKMEPESTPQNLQVL